MHRNILPSFVLGLLATAGFFTTPASASEPTTYRNPIRPGFYPDPSICRVDDTYYLVNSSFAWFPGVPIHKSKDLIHWEQIGNILARPSQLQMGDNVGVSSGIWAPTIRYNNGTFYMITTLQPGQRNFYVTATDPAGPWSEPHFIKDAKGIDPTLFFDDDGKVWYVGNINPPKAQQRWLNEHRIWLQEIDLTKDELIGERFTLTSGDQHGVSMYTEGPHIYKINGKYVLLVAEGGTWERHAVTVFRSDKITGPYERCPENPILTHRHLGNTADITTTGHADLVQTQNGDWWCVLLGVRPFGKERHYTLGRETFLTPAAIENGWPVINPGVGRVLMVDRRPNLPWTAVKEPGIQEDFTAKELGFEWNFLRTPQTIWWSLTEKPGALTIRLRPEKLIEQKQPSLIARRVQHHKFAAYTSVEFTPKAPGEKAGLVVLQNESFGYRLEISQSPDGRCVNLIKVLKPTREAAGPNEETVATLPIESNGPVTLGLRARELELQFSVACGKMRSTPIGEVQDGSLLSTRVAGGFVGAYIGLFASSNGSPSENSAAFDWFDYREIE